jgi:erythromycin esterase
MMHTYKIVVLLLAAVFMGACRPAAEQVNRGNFVEIMRDRAAPLQQPADLRPLVRAAGNARLVLLGESTHGTSEFYSWRGELSKGLIAGGGISFIVVEGDWAAIYQLNRYVKGDAEAGTAREILRDFDRWPQWMWANEEVAEFIEWLRAYNRRLTPAARIGFYGMDVYGQWQAMDYLLDYLQAELPDDFQRLRPGVECFAALDRQEWLYARAVAGGYPSCQQAKEEVVAFLQGKGAELAADDADRYFKALQSALVLKGAEEHFRLSVGGGPASWNSRAQHMNDTVNRLLAHYPAPARGIVWAHNTHVGDARATSMREEGMVNIGKLARLQHGREQVFIVGFTTHTGTVMAGRQWGSPMLVMPVPPAMEGSLEQKLQQTGLDSFFVLFRESDRRHPELAQPRGHRAIGVTYHPQHEQGNYVPTVLPERYDALVFLRQTRAITPVPPSAHP